MQHEKATSSLTTTDPAYTKSRQEIEICNKIVSLSLRLE
jgi:hypothetical protein